MNISDVLLPSCTYGLLALFLAALRVQGVEVSADPCPNESVIQSTENYNFDVTSGTTITTNVCSTTRKCVNITTASELRHWLFVPNPALKGTYTTSTDPSPLCLSVVEDSSLLVELPPGGLKQTGSLTVTFTATNLMSAVLQISYFPHGFYKQSDFLTVEGGGLMDVWRSYGICQAVVMLCEVNSEMVLQPSDLFDQQALSNFDCGPQNRPLTHGITLDEERVIMPEDSRNYTLVLVEGDCSNAASEEILLDSVTVFLVYTPPTTPTNTTNDTTESSSTPTPTTDSSSDGIGTEVIAAVSVVAGVLIVVIIVIIILGILIWRIHRRSRDNEGKERSEDETDGPPLIIDIPGSPSELNDYVVIPGVNGTAYAIEMSESGQSTKVEDRKVTSSIIPPTTPGPNLRTVAIVTDGSGKWYEALEDDLIERHMPCERKDVHLERHSEDLSEYIFGILSDKRLEWFYVVWRDSLEKKTKTSLEGTNGRLWRLVSELKSFPLPDELRRKVVLIQIGAPSTVEQPNHVLTIFIRGLPGNGSEDYSGTEAADDIYRQMKNRDGERIRERVREGQPVLNGLPHPKRSRRDEQGSKSLPPSRRVKGPASSTNRISKSVATSTETLPQRRPDPPVENERPPQPRRDPPVENERPPQPRPDPPVENERPPQPRRDPPVENERPPQPRPDLPAENETPPQPRRDPPVENGELESRAAVSDTAAVIVPHLIKVGTLLEHGNELMKRANDLKETSIQLEKEALAEKKKTDAKINKVADTTEESLDLLRQHNDEQQSSEFDSDDEDVQGNL